MAENDALGNSRQEMVERFTRIPGLGRSRAEAIYEAGYTNVGLLRKASVEELTKIPGVGISLARCVKNNIELVREDAAGAVSVATAAAAAAAPAPSEPGKIVVGEPGLAAEKKPDAPAGTGAAAAQPAQSRGFFSSIFDKILGKPTPAQPAPDKKEPDKKEPEKKEPDNKEPDKKEPEQKDRDKKEPGSSEGVKVESSAAVKKDPDAKPDEKKDPDKNEPAKDEPPKQEGPAPERPTAGARPEAMDDRATGLKPAARSIEIKVDAKPDDRAPEKM